jgi:hypothetical protein
MESTGTRARSAGRWLALVGLVCGVVSLASRAVSTERWGAEWLTLPALAVELAGVAATTLFVWASFGAAWPATQAPLPGTTRGVDVVVRVDAQATQSVRATLIAVRDLDVGEVVLVDLRGGRHGRRSMESVAREYGARYVVARSGDENGLALAATECSAPLLLLLDAGDVPSPEIVGRGRAQMTSSVAIVQAPSTMVQSDSPEQLPSGRHERDFERVLTQWLGVRGVATFAGSGALIRRDLLVEASPTTASPAMAEAEITRRCSQAAGASWREPARRWSHCGLR